LIQQSEVSLKMKPLDRIRAHSQTQNAAPAAEQRPRRGRPVGSKAPTMAKATWLQVEDFYFLRSVINGLSASDSYYRYYSHLSYDSNGNVIVPHGNSLNTLSQSLIRDIQTAAQKSMLNAVHRESVELGKELPEDSTDVITRMNVEIDFENWVCTIPDGMYSENELPERYQEFLEENKVENSAADKIVNRSIAIQNKIRALNYLQTELAKRPTPSQDCRIWFASKIADAFEKANITTLESLIRFIAGSGRHWYRNIAGFKEVRAKRVEAWIDFHVETLGRIDRSKPSWKPIPALVSHPPLQRPHHGLLTTTIDANTGEVTLPSPHLHPRFDIVPIELLLVPPELDGSNGMFRSDKPNQFGVNTDQEVLLKWLRGFLVANKIKTMESYRRETERFYLWCLLERETALSSATLAHAQDYQVFLRNIPKEWISHARVARTDPQWRPFRGPLTPKSQNFAIGVLRHFFDALIKNGYVTSSPFLSIVASTEASRGRVMDTTRSFTTDDLNLMRNALLSLPGLLSKSPVKAALARRMKLIMSLGLTTGLRVAEMSSATLESLKHPVVDGIVGADWIIEVIGKRRKIREIPISENLYELIQSHHADWIALMPRNAARIEHFRTSPPLIAALEAPVQRPTPPMNDRPALPYEADDSSEPKARTSRRITNTTILANDNSALSVNGIYRTMKAFFRYVQRLTDDPKQRTRIAEFSPHWMRHTFAHAILDSSPNDTGLKNAQELLGHASISTTAQYTKQDISAKVKAARKINPLGI
jgi:site-specific recombinase XerD